MLHESQRVVDISSDIRDAPMRSWSRQKLEARQSKAGLIGLTKSAAGDSEALALAFERNLATARESLRHQPLTTTETVDYRELIANPEPVIERVVQFLQRPSLDRQAMIGAIDATLYRSRSGEVDR